MTNFGIVEGKLTLAGVELSTLSLRRALNVVHALMVEVVGAGPEALVARREIDDIFARRTTDPDEPDPETWGMSPEAVAGQEAAMRLFGGGS